MKRILLLFCAFAVSAPLFAIERDDCAGPLTHLGSLYQIRSIMMKRYATSSDVTSFIDRRIEELREPQPGGGYKWVRWVRPSGSGPTEKKVHTVVAVHGQGDPDRFETSSDHVYAVRVVVPSKRSLFKGNNPVYVGELRIKYGKRVDVIHLDRWMQPDTSQTFELDGIYEHVLADAEVSIDPRDVREAVAEIHFKQAVPQDDPANPSYSTIQALMRIRDTPDPATVDGEIAALESSLFHGSDSLPLLTIVRDLRRADELIRSQKEDEQEKGNKLLKETLRRLR